MCGNPRVLASESLRTVLSIDVSVLGRAKPENGICSQFFCKTKKFPEIFEIGQNGREALGPSSPAYVNSLGRHAQKGGGTGPVRGPGKCAEVRGSVRKCAPDTLKGVRGAPGPPRSVRKCAEVCGSVRKCAARVRPVPVRGGLPLASQGAEPVLAGVGSGPSRASGCLQNGLRQISFHFSRFLAEKRSCRPVSFRTSLDRPHTPP